MTKYRLVQNKKNLLYRLEKYDDFMISWTPCSEPQHYPEELEREMEKLIDAQLTDDGWYPPHVVKESNIS